jgi:hypothetical protein
MSLRTVFSLMPVAVISSLIVAFLVESFSKSFHCRGRGDPSLRRFSLGGQTRVVSGKDGLAACGRVFVTMMRLFFP